MQHVSCFTIFVSTRLGVEDCVDPDIVRQNAYAMTKHLEPVTKTPAKLELAKHIQDRDGRQGLTLILFKVAHAAGVLAYLKDTTRRDFFRGYLAKLEQVGHGWSKHAGHREPPEELEDVGGVADCPEDVARDILRWLVLCYVGTEGGRTSYGHVRPVFYSDTAAQIIERLLAARGERELHLLKRMRADPVVRTRLASCKAVAARFEKMLDLAGDK